MRTARAIAALGAATTALLAAPAGLAVADMTAAETIANLEAQGYTVNIDRVGAGPLSDCIVTNVRNPQTNSEYVGVVGDDEPGAVRVITSQTISVSLNCT
ncbi:hypothetical protein BVC93_17620 [Mycobacterium sp. MS1601]|uniref:hypothetical protein n=1 Tax=Mycobacterium sp. MS1601 TaxID=1936029 RepID=UPI000979689F|nr:hypothetical protein [Mycobacterium sp. MS1601]AQA03948.1 hypothetical protein BVC93_17620 [Mycobacterium sp. MS1601]